MENKEMADATSSRRPVCPYSRTTTGVPQAGNFHHHPYSSHRPFQHNPAAAAASSSSSSGAVHFSSPAGPGWNAYQLPLSRATHASAGGASPSLGLGGSMPMDTVSGSVCTATFLSTLGTSLPASSSFVDLQAASSSSLSSPPPVCQLPPLPPSLGGPLLSQTATAVHPADPVYSSGTSSRWMRQPYSSGNTGLTQTPWTPSNTLQLGKNTITSGSGSSSSSPAWVPQPAYNSGNTGLNKTPWTPVPSSNLLPVPWTPAVPSSNTSQLGKNTITSGGSSSAWMIQPAYSSGNKLKGPMVVGSKRKLPSSPTTAWGGSGAAGSSIQYKDDANAPLFTQNEIEKIRMDKDLSDIFSTDPKKVRSILNIRRNLQRSREKKAAYLSGLEYKVEQLQQEKKLLSGLVNSEQSTIFGLTAEKNEMVIKIHGFEQRIQLMDAVNERLYAEVCRLKLAAGEIWRSHVPNSSYQEMGPQTMQQENLLIEDHQEENLLIDDHQQENLLIEDNQQENLLIQDDELAEFMHELEPLVDLDNFLA